MADKKVNGVNALSEQLEQLRMQVVELELKARFWKANFEIRQYSLGFDSLTEKYSEFIAKQQQIDEAVRTQFADKVKELQELGATVEGPTDEAVELQSEVINDSLPVDSDVVIAD